MQNNKTTRRQDAARRGLGAQERVVLEMISERLAQGAHEYGCLAIDTDEREFISEAIEEFLDATVYLTMKLMQIRERDEK